MKQNVISFSFVFLWKRPLNNVPILDNKFCKDLFNDPYNTEVAVGPDGFLITMITPQIPAPNVILGPVRVQFISTELEQVLSVAEKIMEELARLKVSPLEVSAIGVNTEHEFLEMGETAQEYFLARFLKNGFETNSKFLLNMTDIKFTVKGSEDVSYNILIQPRANQLNGIYVNINTHRQVVDPKIPTVDYLKNVYKQTKSELEEKIFPSLGLEG